MQMNGMAIYILYNAHDVFAPSNMAKVFMPALPSDFISTVLLACKTETVIIPIGNANTRGSKK